MADFFWVKLVVFESPKKNLGNLRPEEKFFHSIFMHFSIVVWHRGPSSKKTQRNGMPINYFWWCSHWASSFLGYISPESKKKPHVFFPIMPAKEERNVLWFGFFKWRKPGVKKRYSTYLEKNNQNLRETSSEHGFLPLALVVLFEVPPFGTPHFFSAGENFPATSLQPKCRSTSPWREFFGNSWDSDFKEVWRFNHGKSQVPPFLKWWNF